MGYFKTNTTKEINRMRGTPGSTVWQKRFYERIIRTEADYFRIKKYIRDNPGKWGL